jgi:Na+/phosphate symporter
MQSVGSANPRDDLDRLLRRLRIAIVGHVVIWLPSIGAMLAARGEGDAGSLAALGNFAAFAVYIYCIVLAYRAQTMLNALRLDSAGAWQIVAAALFFNPACAGPLVPLWVLISATLKAKKAA